MARATRHRQIAGRLGLAINAQGRERLVLTMKLGHTVKHIVRTHMHKRDAVLSANAGHKRGARGVGVPACRASLGCLRTVNRRVRATVDNRAIERPVNALVGCRGHPGQRCQYRSNRNPRDRALRPTHAQHAPADRCNRTQAYDAVPWEAHRPNTDDVCLPQRVRRHPAEWGHSMPKVGSARFTKV